MRFCVFIFDNNFLDSVNNLYISEFWFSDELTTKFTDDATENIDDVEDRWMGKNQTKIQAKWLERSLSLPGKPSCQHFRYINEIIVERWPTKLIC
jgi:hypothetical protein